MSYFDLSKTITKQIGGPAHEVAAKVDEYARGMISASGSTLFEELGLYYIGPVDGHNVGDLVTIFEKVKAMPAPGPVLIHIVTEKGKGYPPAEAAPDKMHGEMIDFLSHTLLCEFLAVSSVLIPELSQVLSSLTQEQASNLRTNRLHFHILSTLRNL